MRMQRRGLAQRRQALREWVLTELSAREEIFDKLTRRPVISDPNFQPQLQIMPNQARIEQVYLGKEATVENVVGSQEFSDLELAWLKAELAPYMHYLQWLFGAARGRT